MSSKTPEYVRVSQILAELEQEGLDIPTDTTVRRWVNDRKIRAMRVGAGRLLVSREDVRKMVTPTPVGAP